MIGISKFELDITVLDPEIYIVNSTFKNVYIDKYQELVGEYNNATHKAIKIESVFLNLIHILTLMLKLIQENLNSILVIMYRSQKFSNEIGLKFF